MTVINLTNEFYRNKETDIRDRLMQGVRRFCGVPDFYYASTLKAMREHFKENPPKQVDYSLNQFLGKAIPTAIVILKNCALRRNEDCPFSEDNPENLESLNKYGVPIPFFDVKDVTLTCFASWRAGKSDKLLEVIEQLGLYKGRDYVSIPNLHLQYFHTESETGVLTIEYLSDGRPTAKDEKTLTEKLMEFIPEIESGGELAPQPI